MAMNDREGLSSFSNYFTPYPAQGNKRGPKRGPPPMIKSVWVIMEPQILLLENFSDLFF